MDYMDFMVYEEENYYILEETSSIVLELLGYTDTSKVSDSILKDAYRLSMDYTDYDEIERAMNRAVVWAEPLLMAAGWSNDDPVHPGIVLRFGSNREADMDCPTRSMWTNREIIDVMNYDTSTRIPVRLWPYDLWWCSASLDMDATLPDPMETVRIKEVLDQHARYPQWYWEELEDNYVDIYEEARGVPPVRDPLTNGVNKYWRPPTPDKEILIQAIDLTEVEWGCRADNVLN